MLIAAFASKAILSWGRYFNQDEFESLHQGWLLHSGALQFKDFNSNHPPFFFEVLRGLHSFDLDPVQVMYAARGLTLVLALIQLALVFGIAQAVFGRRAGVWATVLYATTATFLEWSIEIRTDALMVPLWLAATYLLVQKSSLRPTVRLTAIGFLLGCGLWTNQKIVLLGIPMVAFLALGGPRREWKLRDLWAVVLGGLVPTIVCLVSAAINGNLQEMIEHNFVGAAHLAATDPYAGWRPIVGRDLLSRDTGFVVVGTAAVVWLLAGWQRLACSHRYVGLAAIWGAVTFFLTPGPIHYYLLSILPMVAIAAGGALAAWPTARQPFAIAMALIYLVPPVGRLAKVLPPTNETQLEIVRVGSAMTAPDEAVFDGAGILFQRPDAYGFYWVLWTEELREYRRRNRPPVVHTVRNGEGRLVLLNYRVKGLPQKDLRDLLRHFPRLWGPICVPGFDSGPDEPIGIEPHEFELWYEGVYEVLPRGRVRIDGQLADGLVTLPAGSHTASVDGLPSRVTVRDASYMRKLSLPPEPAEWQVFGRYGYHY